MKSKLFKILSILMVLSLLVVPATAKQSGPEGSVDGAPRGERVQYTGNYIVVFNDAGLAQYTGSVAGLDATQPAEGQKLNSKSSAAAAYLAYLNGLQDKFVGSLAAEFNHEVKEFGRLHYAVSAVIVKLSAIEARQVERMPGVAKVYKETIETLDTDAGPAWIGAPSIWDGTAVAGNLGTMGEDILVGIIDSGINSDHPSFADVGGDGYDHNIPSWMTGYVGVCDPTDPAYDPTFVCNDKLVGAWEYTFYYYDNTNPDLLEYSNPEDEDGHGSHTASTTAGNVVTATLYAPTTQVEQVISGVAPHANIIAYDVCYLNTATGQGSCPGGALADAVDQSIGDGVDVINYSISGGTNPAGDLIENLFFWSVYYNNTFISTSAGNSGPTESTVAHRSPWVTSTAAETHDRQFGNDLIDMTGGDTTPPADLIGKGFTAGLASTSIVYAGDYVNSTPGTPDPVAAARCYLNYFSPGTFTGKIVVCDRGVSARVEKAEEVARVGAVGFVLANNASSGASLNADAFVIPGVHLTYDDGVALKAWMATGTGHMATILGNYRDVNPDYGDITASFSSRGPNPLFDILKPDITAPGVDVWAAVNTVDDADPPEYGLLSGTSMSSPHDAGAAALLKGVFGWTFPHMRMRSAMMLTSQPYVWPYSVNASGAGRVDLTKAALTGLVMPQSNAAMYNAFYAGSGQDFRTFNLASIMDSQCVVSCTWSRTFASNLSFTATYTASFETFTPNFAVNISPAVFTLAPGASQVVQFTMDVSQIAVSDYAEGMAWLETDATFPIEVEAPFGGEDVSDAHLPILVRSRAINMPPSIDITAYEISGTHELPNLVAVDVANLIVGTYGMAKADVIHKMVEGDPTNGEPYDVANGGTFVELVTVPADTQRFVAEIIHSTSNDVDMFIGLDANSNGIPEEGEWVAQSATGEVFEYVNLNNPDAGTYWVLVQNWEASGDTLDIISLSTAVVPQADSGNIVVTAPVSTTSGVPFSVFIDWDIPTLQPGERYYGAFSLGDVNEGDLGTTNIDFHHTYSAMFSYYDGEGVVGTGESVTIAGAFNGWNTTVNALEDQGDGLYVEYTFDMGYCATSGYKYVVKTAAPADEYDFLNSNDRSADICEDMELDYVDWRNIEPGYYQLFGTTPVTLTLGTLTDPYTVSIWAKGLTEHGDAPRALLVDLGLGMETDPAAWTAWYAMDWAQQTGNNDDFEAALGAGVYEPGQYYVAGRINGNWAWGNPNNVWAYVDMDWSDPNFVIDDAAVLYTWLQHLFLPFVRR